MNKFENVDVLASLQQIMQQNTAAFQNDFDIDKKILTRAAKSKNAEDKVYLWFSRPNGTHCLRERDVFLRGTREHNTFRFYHEQTKERVLAYAVVLSGMESGKVKGSIYELDYAAKAELAIQTALRTDNNRLIYEKGSRELPKEYRFEATPDREYGKFVRYEAVPHDPDALRDLLRDESRKRERLKPGNFKEHIGRLSDEKVLAEAQRLSATFQSLQAPNSPMLLIIACALLALQFLTQMRETKARYATLSILGARREQMKRSINQQVLWYFLLPLLPACISGTVGIFAMQQYLYSNRAKLQQSYPMLLVMALVVVCMLALYGVAIARTANREISKLNWKPNS